MDCYLETNKVEYANCDNNDEMSIYERYLILKFKPKYNVQYNTPSTLNFDLPELTWEKYDFKLKINKKKEIVSYNIIDLYKEYGFKNINEIINFNVKKFIIHNKLNIKSQSNSRNVACIDNNSYECINIYNNSNEAGRLLGLHSGNIYKSAKKNLTCGGYSWRFIDELLIN